MRGSDEFTDLAVLEVEGDGMQAVALGRSQDVRVGDFSVAVGNPFGLAGTFTTGVVSAVDRRGIDDSGLRFIQTDASINQGNSGGPLLNLRGEVIGINRMIFSLNGGSVGIGFAIPTDEALKVVEQLVESGEIARPFLGLEIRPVPAGFADGRGAFVVSVFEQTGAWKAGLRANDIVVKMDNVEIETPGDLVLLVRGKQVGEVVEVEVFRGGQRFKLSVTLSRR